MFIDKIISQLQGQSHNKHQHPQVYWANYKELQNTTCIQ